ncbi:transcriptional regulator [Actinoplanes sp. NBRC 14428]|uniref:ArsR family transcriptional regulator n=1 Tax=Pseudosporangium ferrugineum TaxID=439699 RepID=A0A2T0S272_9ACTN|nr:helix-turn-helix domain-containing protein [Pseudosporangium ferrugineum]PRY27515.1 ArsR family transcriptional regulator [Pseudosporangium ferrugineum]BCJ55722.1 transcriptional regulator [Actinoplanes sp. NBRC 14428]
MEQKEVHLDARQIRVLAHPLRFRLLGRLRLDGPATATRLARALGTNTGATSYHLRQLADVGLVLEEERPGRGRERWWRSAHDVTSWQRDTFAGDPDATAAADWLEGSWLRSLVSQAETWQRIQRDEPEEWRRASNFSDYWLDLSAEQLDALNTELNEVVERYRAAGPAPGSRQIVFYLYGMPRVDEP